MPRRAASEPITTETSKVAEIDALPDAMERSRNDVIEQATERYLAASAWQVERIREGLAAAREGRVLPAGDVFAGIAAKHGWPR